MDFSSVWATVEPYVLSAGYFLVSSGILAFVGRAIANRVTKKVDTKEISNNVSDAVTNKLTNTEVRMSLETVNKAQMAEIHKYLAQGTVVTQETLHKQNRTIIAMGKVLLHLKASTEEEKKELLDSLNDLEEDDAKIELPVENVVTVEIKPIETKQEDNGVL